MSTVNRALKPYAPVNLDFDDTSTGSGGTAITNVTWGNELNVSDVANVITRTHSPDNWGDAGAYTNESIPSLSDGSLFWTVAQTDHHKAIGIVATIGGHSYLDCGFTFAVNATDSNVYLYDNGTYTGVHFAVTAGDALEIRRTGTTITFYQNGTLKHTITGATTAALYGCVALYSDGGIFSGVQIGLPASASGRCRVTWSNRNRKTSGIKKQTDSGDALESGQTHTLKIYGQDGTTLLHTESSLTAELFDYTAVNEVADAGALQTSLTIKIQSTRDSYLSPQVVKTLTR